MPGQRGVDLGVFVGVVVVQHDVQLPAGVTTPFTIAGGGAPVVLTVLECGTTPMDSTFLTINSNATTPAVSLALLGPTTGCTP